MWGCGVWGSGEWAYGVRCAVVWPPLHLLHVRKNHEKPKVKFSPRGINFCRLILWGQILMNIKWAWYAHKQSGANAPKLG